MAFELYATHGLPLELTRDIAREQGLDVDQTGFQEAMEAHRVASGAGKAFGPLGGEDVDIYRRIFEDLKSAGKLNGEGVAYDPYSTIEVEGEVLAVVREGEVVSEAYPGEVVEVILPRTCFYIESGGQVSDTGKIVSTSEPRWELQVEEMRKPAAGIVVHSGRVLRGVIKVGDGAIARVDAARRRDIMRNHTATHLLHAELQAVLGSHARQAGSLVAPDRLRFDFTHPEALTREQIEKIEEGVNRAILANYRLETRIKPLQQAVAEGAMALFGEKYAENVRTVTIGATEPISYELCGGTHVEETADIGLFLITGEGSAAAGIRRIEAVTGRAAYELVQKRFRILRDTAEKLGSSMDEIPSKVEILLEELVTTRKENHALRQAMVTERFESLLQNTKALNDISYLAVEIPGADVDSLRSLADRFRQRHPHHGVVVLASVLDGKPLIIGSITDDLIKKGFHAGELVKRVAQVVGGGGGGRPNMAQAGGRDAEKLPQALQEVESYIREKMA